jgi:hypothetical protein
MCTKNAYIWLAMSVCPSICMIQLENCWTDLDEIWCGQCVIGMYSKVILAFWMGQSFQQQWQCGASQGDFGVAAPPLGANSHVEQAHWMG